MLAAAAVTEAEPTRLFHTQHGASGPRVVFLHGLFGQGRNWTTIAKALGGQARVSLVDLPNHGRSPWTDHFSYPEMADQVADLIRAEAGGEPYAVVGHSMGGKVAMALALLHPDLVERLCVVDVSPVARRVSGFETYVRGLRSIDLDTLPDRSSADSQLQPYVPEAAIRGFLLQNLRREHPPAGGWRWQMNLSLLGDHLTDMGDWPDIFAGRGGQGGSSPRAKNSALPISRTDALAGRIRVPLHPPGVRPGDARALPPGPIGHRQGRRPLAAQRPAGGIRDHHAPVPASVTEPDVEG